MDKEFEMKLQYDKFVSELETHYKAAILYSQISASGDIQEFSQGFEKILGKKIKKMKKCRSLDEASEHVRLNKLMKEFKARD